MRLTSREQNEYYNMGKQGLACLFVIIGVLDLLF
jgi:hypothetical protein